MTTIFPQNYTCMMCKHTFDNSVSESANAFPGQNGDFCSQEGNSCPKCGYVDVHNESTISEKKTDKILFRKILQKNPCAYIFFCK